MARRGGITLALLKEGPVRGGGPRGNQSSSEAPVRLAVLFSGNGFHSKEWWAKGEGKQMELGKVLAPLKAAPSSPGPRANTSTTIRWTITGFALRELPPKR